MPQDPTSFLFPPRRNPPPPPGTGPDDQPLFSLNVFSAQLVSSREFELGGRRYDLRRLMPNGITQWGTAAATPVESPHGFVSVTPFVGSAIAIGGEARSG